MQERQGWPKTEAQGDLDTYVGHPMAWTVMPEGHAPVKAEQLVRVEKRLEFLIFLKIGRAGVFRDGFCGCGHGSGKAVRAGASRDVSPLEAG